MGKPKNVDLLAERKAITALLESDEGVSNADAVRALKEERDRLKAAFRAVSTAPSVPPPPPVIPSTLVAVAADDGDVPEIFVGKPTGPIDYAQYPGMPGQIQPAPPAVSAMTAAQGDLTPGYARWFLSANGPEKMREKYGERVTFLPKDVQEALQ